MGCGRLHRFQRLLPPEGLGKPAGPHRGSEQKIQKARSSFQRGRLHEQSPVLLTVPTNVVELKGNNGTDLEQADWYSAMFSACAKRPWVMGFGVWDWPADSGTASAYAVSGRPAAKIIHSAYQGEVLE